MNCSICGGQNALVRLVHGLTYPQCDDCAQVSRLIPTLGGVPFVIVDGSWRQIGDVGVGGAGLVLAMGSPVARFVALCSCTFASESSSDAEWQAVVRGRLWAPTATIYSDHRTVVQHARSQGWDVRWIREEDRVPNHQFAHRLSREGRRATEQAVAR